MSDNRIISQISDQSEREHLLWNQVFTKLAKLDGVNDNLIDRAALVNLIWQMDLNERIKFVRGFVYKSIKSQVINFNN